jgi:hypothetical protein
METVMARNTYESIIEKLDAAIAAKEIWNVDFKDLSFDAGSLSWKEHRDGPILDWSKMGDDERDVYFNHRVPSSPLHMAGFLKRTEKFAGKYVWFDDVRAFAARWAVIGSKFKEVKPFIKKGRKPNTGIIQPRSNTICQICARQIELFGKVISHHGYQRPGDGQQTASCMGARELSFNKDRTVLAKYIEQVKDEVKSLNKTLKLFEEDKVEGVPGPAVERDKDDPIRVAGITRYKNPIIGRDHAEWMKYLRLAMAQTETELRHVESHLKWQQGRYNTWQPVEEIVV